MECSDVQKVLPEYLAGKLDRKTKQSVAMHLKGCATCQAEADALGVSSRVLGKTRRRFVTLVAAIVLVFAGVVGGVNLVQGSLVETAVRGSDDQISKGQVLAEEFGRVWKYWQPDVVTGYGPTLSSRWGENLPWSLTTQVFVGRTLKDSRKKEAWFQPWEGGLNVQFPENTNWFDYPVGEATAESVTELERQLANLAKNSETTVSTLDLSLNQAWDLKDLIAKLEPFDLQPLWLALETGFEATWHFNGKGVGPQRWVWGVPAHIYTEADIDGSLPKFRLNLGNLEEFVDRTRGDLSTFQRLSASIPERWRFTSPFRFEGTHRELAQAVLDRGFRVYGVRLTGPTKQLIAAARALSPRSIKVVAIDFLNW